MARNRLTRDIQRDMAAPLPTTCGTHGTPLDEKRRCADCAAQAEADLAPAFEAVAEEIATWNPAHAIEGWRLGSLADGHEFKARIYHRALEIQKEWNDR